MNRRTVGDLQYQVGSEVTTHNDLVIVDRGACLLGSSNAGTYPPGNLAFRLDTGDVRQANSSPPPFGATIYIDGVPLGASEIDLDDQRARVSAQPFGQSDTPYHDVTGHLSVRELVQDCVWNCPMRANGTLTISAVGPSGEVFSFTSVTFTAADEVHEGMCFSQD